MGRPDGWLFQDLSWVVAVELRHGCILKTSRKLKDKTEFSCRLIIGTWGAGLRDSAGVEVRGATHRCRAQEASQVCGVWGLGQAAGDSVSPLGPAEH